MCELYELRTSVAIAENMPVQVQASLIATQQAQARYKVGLATRLLEVAEANQVLAQSRMQ